MEKTKPRSEAEQYAAELFAQIPQELKYEVIDSLFKLGHEEILNTPPAPMPAVRRDRDLR